MAANIYKAIERQAIPHAASLVSKYVTISLGFTVYTGGLKMGQDRLIHAADQALYRAKATRTEPNLLSTVTSCRNCLT